MTCPACHSPVAPGLTGAPARRFCGACGARLVQPCGRCDFPAPVQDRFCGGCAAPLGAAAELPLPPPHARPPLPAPAAAACSRLSLEDLAVLLPASAPAAPAGPALSARVSQAELDALFGGAQ